MTFADLSPAAQRDLLRYRANRWGVRLTSLLMRRFHGLQLNGEQIKALWAEAPQEQEDKKIL